LPAGHRGQTLAVSDRFRQFLVEHVLHLWFFFEQIDLRRTTDHVQVDYAFGFGRKVWRDEAFVIGSGAGERRRGGGLLSKK